MNGPKKLILSAAMSAGLLAGGIAASAPAQAAGPIYYGGGSSTAYIAPCLAEQRQIAANRNYRIIKSCHLTYLPGGYGIPAYYFTYQAAY